MINRRKEVEVKRVDGIKYKKCNYCEHWFPLSADYYHRNSRQKTGFVTYCKKCVKLREVDPDGLKINEGSYSEEYSHRYNTLYGHIRQNSAISEPMHVSIGTYSIQRLLELVKTNDRYEAKQPEVPEDYVIWMREHITKRRHLWRYGER